MDKPFTIGILRQITDQYEAGDISYGKMVEMLNEIAMNWKATISKMETTQTAVDWLHNQWSNEKEWSWEKIESWFKQAKQMEKEQIINAYIDGELQQGYEVEAEQYYKETYGSNNQI